MERIVLRHISGSKANQVEEFPLNHIKELIFGRDPSATVKFDPDRDDLVGRQHARIAQDANDPTQFTLSDLNSRNGTYLNRQRIDGPAKLTPGDTIQLGPGGPEIQFDLEPRPASALRPTRAVSPESFAPTVSGPATNVPQTRAVNVSAMSGAAPPPSTTGTVGKATVERMISQNIAITKRSEGRKFMAIGGASIAAILVLFAAVAGYLFYRSGKTDTSIGDLTKNTPLSATQIAQSKGNAVVMIEVSWKLIAPDGGLVYHKGGCLYGPCFIEVADGVIEPVLTDEQQRNGGQPINGTFTASGFVVSNDGFILTNRHVVYAWKSIYPFSNMHSGTLYKRDGGFPEQFDPSTTSINWVPELATIDKQIELIKRINQVFDRDKKTKTAIINRGTLTSITGVNDKLEVAFPGSNSRITAQLVRASEDQDVAMIKISVPDTTPKVEPYDNYDSIKQGDTAVVMGYPETSPPIYGFSPQSGTNRAKLKEIPDPTVSVGNIGRLIRPRKEVAGKRETLNVYGDAFQLSVNATGESNSGGPVFDDRGRVIGIFVAKGADSSVSFAIPIRYGKELMSIGAAR